MDRSLLDYSPWDLKLDTTEGLTQPPLSKVLLYSQSRRFTTYIAMAWELLLL